MDYEALCSINGYNESFKMREGHDLNVRFKENFRVDHLAAPLYRYRIHDSNRTKNKEEVSVYNDMLKSKKESI